MFLTPQRWRVPADPVVCKIWAWDALRRRARIEHLFAPAVPPIDHPGFPVTADLGTCTWLRKLNLTSMGGIYHDGTFIALQQALSEHDTNLLDVFTYCQLRASQSAFYSMFPEAPPAFQTLQTTLTNPSRRKLITRLYTEMQGTAPICTPKSKVVWDSDIMQALTDEDWQYCCVQA
ncbi:hypothetical protein NDU88_002174 [Pleurodeles waltl]|uniref:Uncharacterized protein n=1 Tax=Pleurodeles waltl TaxID=8319 RepID=A0AAV7VDV0_PLEWA|nr:hypothetical protein NDU88_002174 [Pleurodeles waltl]